MKKVNGKLLAVDIAECAIFVALMCIFTLYVKIPFWPVALTFQTVISVLAGLLLGWKKGAISMAVYCFMGLIGIPVFSSSAAGGFAYVCQPTFGYIIGFIAAAAVAGLISSKPALPLWRYIVGAIAAFAVNYLFGIPYFSLIWKFYMHRSDLSQFIVTYNFLYMPKDAVLCVIAAFVAWKVLPVISRGRKKVVTEESAEKEPDEKPAEKPAEQDLPTE